jgi:TetR/AcrR family transcriptional repressor of nem operon
MMNKGEKTKKHIIEQTAILMNQHGFVSTPLSEIVKATGVQKGGIYNHFKDKEELSLLAFDHCFHTLQQYLYEAASVKSSSIERLKSFIHAYFTLAQNPAIPGGCPIMNASTEADDGQSPKLLERAQTAMQTLIIFLSNEITAGIDNKELNPDIDPNKTAALIMATIEGGILLDRLFNDNAHIEKVKNLLLAYFTKELLIRS